MGGGGTFSLDCHCDCTSPIIRLAIGNWNVCEYFRVKIVGRGSRIPTRSSHITNFHHLRSVPKLSLLGIPESIYAGNNEQFGKSGDRV